MDRSEAKKAYKQAKRPMGVYRIRNTQNDKSYIGCPITNIGAFVDPNPILAGFYPTKKK
jgi:hypothetical protein